MDINVEYLIINSYMLNNLNKIIDNFNTVKKMFIDKNISIDKIKQLSSELNNDYKGFLYNETIYKVKSDEDE